MRAEVITQKVPKVFVPIRIQILIESEAELKYMKDKVGLWQGTTYPLYAVLCDLERGGLVSDVK